MPNDNGQQIAVQRSGAVSTFQADLDEYSPQLLMALPAHVSLDKFKRVALTAISQNPDLVHADRRSLFASLAKCAADGLLPDGRESALTVRNTKVKRRDPETGLDREVYIKVCVYLPMIAGLRKRMRNTAEVLSADAEVVYRNDKFRYSLGDNGSIEHTPAPLGEDRGDPLGAYAIIRLKNGEVLRDVLTMKEIEAARAQGGRQGKNESLMWTTFWSEGAKKTALRRCAKAAPQSAELEALLIRDEELPELPEQVALPPMRDPEPEPQRTEYIEQREPEPDPEPQFSVVDWEGFVRDFRTAEKAEEALAMVLTESAKRGLDALNAACEDNPCDGWPADNAGRISTLIAHLVAQIGLDAKAQRAAPPPVSEKPEPPKDTPAPEQAPPAAPQAPRARSVPRRDPSADLLQPEPREEVVPHPNGPQPAAASRQHNATPPASGSGADAGERKSQRIAPCDLGGKADWRSWAVALFFPALRAKTDSSDLAFLLGDNEENIERAKAAGIKDEIDAAIKAQWAAVPA